MTESIIEECPVCLDSFSPPIMLCIQGHSICGKCYEGNRLPACPVCRAEITGSRNYQLEHVIEKLQDAIVRRKCKNFNSGCTYEIINDDNERHHKECPKRNAVCEGNKNIASDWTCSWTGKYEDMVQHFETQHSGQLLQHRFCCKNQCHIKLNLQEHNCNVYLVNLNNGAKRFWFKYEVDFNAKKVYVYYQFIGKHEEAINYVYKLQISQEDYRELKVAEICESDSKDNNEIILSEKCAVFSSKNIENYINAAGELHFNCSILRIETE